MFAQQKGSKAWTVLMTMPQFTFKKAASGLWSAFPFVSSDRHLLMGMLTAALSWTCASDLLVFCKMRLKLSYFNWCLSYTRPALIFKEPWVVWDLEITCFQFHFTDRIRM